MNPVMIHADGSDCRHEGTPQAAALEDGGLLCPGGVPVTHVRFYGKTLTIEEACASLQSVAGAFASLLTPMVTAVAEFGRKISADPAVRALAAASAVVDEERQREGDESCRST